MPENGVSIRGAVISVYSFILSKQQAFILVCLVRISIHRATIAVR